MEFIFISGNLGKAAEVHQSKDGSREFMTFSMAVNRRDRQGNKVTTWYDVVSSQVKMSPYLQAGNRVDVLGLPTVRTYTDKNGNAVGTIRVLADRIEFANSGSGSQPKTNTPATPYAAPVQAAPSASNGALFGAAEDDGLPF